MKKLVVLLFILLPLLVLADDAGPSILGYDAIVINQNGAKDIFDSKKIFKYNAKVHVFNEYEGEGKYYVEVCNQDYYDKHGNCYYDGVQSTILLKDIIPLKDEFIPSDKDVENDHMNLSKTKKKIYVFEKNGIKLLKGPSKIYQSYEDVVPSQSFLNPKYTIEQCFDSGECNNLWFYIDEGGFHGWVDVTYGASYSVGTLLEDTIMLVTDTKMLDENNKEIMTIPSETVITKMYYIGRLSKYYLEYNGKKGYIGVYDSKSGKLISPLTQAVRVNQEALSLKDINIVSMKGEVRGTIPFGKEFKIIYAGGIYDDNIESIYIDDDKHYFYVQYGNIKGFVNKEKVLQIHDKPQKELLKNPYEVNMYELSGNEMNKLSIVIPKNTSLYAYYHLDLEEYDANIDDSVMKRWYLVRYNNVSGWINLENGNKIVKPTSKPEVIKNKKNNLSSKEMILYSIIGASVLGLTAFVTILLINKKKQKKTVNKQDMQIKKVTKRDVIIDDNKKK